MAMGVRQQEAMGTALGQRNQVVQKIAEQATEKEKEVVEGQNLIAEASMGIMDAINNAHFSDGTVIAVGIVAIIEKDEMTYSRTYTTEKIFHRAVGLMLEGYEVVKDGRSADDDEEEDDEPPV